MKHADQDKASLREEIPTGFSLEPCGRDAFIIRHTRTGMRCRNIFLVVWLTGWTVTCVFVLRQYLGGGVMDDGSPIRLWFVLLFWAVEIGVACLLIYLLFCKKSFRIDRENLVIQTDILGLKRYRPIPRQSIKKLVQVMDGGEGEDSFPSWGLKVEWDKSTSLIFQQPHEKSLWLGRTLAEWADVEFSEVSGK